MPPAASLPNVVVVMTTQLRAQSLGYAGDSNAWSPHLDELAATCVDCVQAVTPHPFGVFARSAFLTARFCPANGVRDYYDALPERADTLARQFARHKYETAFFGKWGLYARDREYPVVGEEQARMVVPSARRGGFDFWQGFEGGFQLNDGWYHGSDNPEPCRIEGYQSDVVLDRCIQFIDQPSERPLFAYVSLDAPHPPYAAPAAGVVPPQVDALRVPDDVPSDETVRATALPELAGYYAHIEATDRALGRLIDSLKSSDRWENTVFVFTSAHGDMHGSHGRFRKGWPYEEAVRVPLLLSFPRLLRQPRKDPALISLVDLGPTLLGLLGKEWEGHVDGRDWSARLLLKAEGGDRQRLSMPSAPPFAKQCPYAWTAERWPWETRVERQDGSRFVLART